jgi:hypothetical protein
MTHSQGSLAVDQQRQSKRQKKEKKDVRAVQGQTQALEVSKERVDGPIDGRREGGRFEDDDVISPHSIPV